jgi:hypothetical protein
MCAHKFISKHKGIYMAITQTQILNLIVSMYNATPGATHLKSLNDIVAAKGATYTLANLADDLAAGDLYKSQYTGMDNTAKADSLMATFGYTKNVFGLYDTTEEMTAYDFFTTQLTAGSSLQSLQLAAVEFMADATNAASFPVAAATLTNKTAVSEYYSVTKSASANTLAELQAAVKNVTDATPSVDAAKATIDAMGTVTGLTYNLTDGADNLTGTSGDDMFMAYVVQNSNGEGAVTNQLATGDMIDGGAGAKDELSAKVIADQVTQDGANLEINAITKNVEMARYEVIEDLQAVTVDAGAMNSVKEYWSDNSEGNLTVEDIRLGDLAVTKDIAFGIKDADFRHNFTADFASNALTNAGTTKQNAQILIEAAYEAAPSSVTSANPTKDLFVKVTFTGTKADGTTGTFDSGYLRTNDTTLDSTDMYPDTYEGLKNLIDATLDAQGFTNLTVELGGDITAIETGAGIKPLAFTAKQIKITDPAGNAFSAITSSAGTESTDAASDVASRIIPVDPTTSTTLIESTLVLDNAGQGSTMGNVDLGGMSNSNKGIQKLTIMADRDSAISTLTGSSATLKEVVITSDVNTLKDTTSANGSLEIDTINNWTTLGTSIDASAFKGTNLMLGKTTEIDTATDIVNLNTLSANIAANVTFEGQTTENDRVDSDETYTYTTGSGNDVVTFTLDGDSVDAHGEAFTLSTNSGNDSITLSGLAGVSQTTMSQLNNLSIDSGAGSDTIRLDSYQNFNINAGADSDFVRIDSTNLNGNATALATTIGQSTGGQIFGARVLYNAKATVSFAGLEKTVDISTSATNNFVATQLDINTAVKLAISTSPELSKLLSATDVMGTEQLQITALVGGLNDLSIDIYQPELIATGTAAAGQTLISNTDVDALRKGLLATEAVAGRSADLENASEIATFTGTTLTGVNTFDGSINNVGTGTGDTVYNLALNTTENTGTALNTANAYTYVNQTAMGTDATVDVNYSTINLGDGANDLLVLHSNDLSMNTIVIDGTFGKNTIVNMHDISPNDVGVNKANVGLHQLDFTSILNNMTDASTAVSGANNTDSAVRIATTLHDAANTFTTGATASNDSNAVANGINVLHYNQNVATTSVKFADLTAAQLQSKLNDQAGTDTTVLGGLDHTSLTIVEAGANLVGTTQNHIIMVENNSNLGEYKVFKATSTLDATDKTKLANSDVDDFTTVELLGTLDFGYSINFNAVGGTTSASLSALIAAADAGTAVTVDGIAQIVATTENGAAPGTGVVTPPVTPPVTGQTAKVLTDADADTAAVPVTIDASTADFKFTFSNAGTDTFNITGFSTGDTLDVVDTYTKFIGTSTNGIQVGYYDADFDPTTIINIYTTDAALIASVSGAADTAAAEAAIDAVWGADWLM